MDPQLMKDIVSMTPLLLLTAGSLILLMFEVFLKGNWPRGLVTVVLLLLSLVSYSFVSPQYGPGEVAFGGLIAVDDYTYFFSVLMIAGTLLSVLMGIGQLSGEGIESPSEYYSLLLMSLIGALIFVSAAEMITLFLGLEIMSMALYPLCGSALGKRASSEAALKYFLLGSFSSAFLLYGIALLYGLSGSTVIVDIAEMANELDSTMLLFAIGLLVVGFVFKIGAVPFHFWAPDVYQGSPTTVTAYMACVIKTAAIGAALRVLWGGFGDLLGFWSGAVWAIALLTMVVGNLVALRQRSMKRMLAYSSIAHAGYMMTAFLAKDDQFGGGPAILFYLISYTVITIGSFGVVLAISRRYGSDLKSDDISRFYGLAKRSPIYAALMALFMLSLAGIPPGMAGLLGKVYIFSAAIKSGYIGLAIVGVLMSAVSCYYYLRVIVAMYFMDGEDTDPLPDVPFALGSALAFCAAGAVLFGIYPSALYEGAVVVISGMM